MADEIQLGAVRMKVVKAASNINETFIVEAQTPDMAGNAISEGTSTIPTTAGGTAISVNAAVTTLGWAIFKNQGPTNYVEIGLQVGGTFYPFMKLLAGEESYPIRLGMASNALYALANTASVDLTHKIVEA